MKMRQTDFNELKLAIEPLIKQYPGAYKCYHDQGMSDTRYNWDLLNASGFKTGPLYLYLHDEHISTALKAITGKTGG